MCADGEANARAAAGALGDPRAAAMRDGDARHQCEPEAEASIISGDRPAPVYVDCPRD